MASPRLPPSKRIWPRAASSSSIAVCVGQTVWRPCSAYQRARRVEHAHHHALDVEAPAGDLGDHEVGVVAVRGGHERVRPVDAGREQRVDLERGADGEAAAALLPSPRAGRGRAGRSPRGPRRGRRPRGPRLSMELAIADPTRPQPTIRTNMRVSTLHTTGQGATPSRTPSRPSPPTGRRGEDHLAGRLLRPRSGSSPHEAVARPAAARPASPRRASGSAPPPRARSPPPRGAGLGHDRLPDRPPATIAVATSTPSYSSPTSLARATHALGLVHALVGHAGVDRQRHRYLEHVERLEHRAALPSSPARRRAGRRCRRCRRRAPRRRPARGCSRTRPRSRPGAPRPGS